MTDLSSFSELCRQLFAQWNEQGAHIAAVEGYERGMLDADLQPSSLKGWQRGALAYVLAERFDIKHVWVKMAQMWKCNNSTLRQYYSKEFTQKKSIEFTKKIKAIIY